MNVLFLVELALFVALELIFCFTPLGSLPITPGIVATLAHIPALIGGLVLGWKAGLTLGAVMGLSSLYIWTVTPPNPLIAFIFSPFVPNGNIWSLVIVLVPRTIFPALAFLCFVWLCRKIHPILAAGIAGGVGSALHSILVLSLIYGAFHGQEAVGGVYTDFLVAWGGLNAVLEIAVAVVVCLALVYPLMGLQKAVPGAQNRSLTGLTPSGYPTARRGSFWKTEGHMSTILAVDVGNTNIVLGVFVEEELRHSWRLGSDRVKTSDEFGIVIMDLYRFNGLKPEDTEGVIISSVVPEMMYSLAHMCRTYFKCDPMVVGAGMKTGLNILIDNPKELGPDMILDAVSALERYGRNKAMVIVDFGTATTISVLSAKNDFLGGVIASGIRSATDGLVQRTAKLPYITLEKPPVVIGKNTTHSMQAGRRTGARGHGGRSDRADQVGARLCRRQ